MLWQQAKNLRSPWLRVMTPDAGTSGEVPKNRGMVFIPEIGDHVMLGFHHHNPNKPLVLGSLFNGTTGAGGQEKNHLKSIFTRGGSTITFNELDNSILIKDPSGNTWFMDGKGNITTTAPETMTFNCKNMNINVAQNMNTSVGMNISENAGMNKATNVGLLNTLSVGGMYMMTVMGKMIRKVMGDFENNVEGNKQSVVQGESTTHSEKKHAVNSKEGMNHNSVEKTKTH
jgi:type VI secretion system secreted protein VgrG